MFFLSLIILVSSDSWMSTITGARDGANFK